ncbi:MAG: thioesterase family protein [Planctomycetaceae bacterium]|nr:thioesterase family protein [Planctomycetaceae bacterium]
MPDGPKIGSVYELRFRVKPEHTISLAGESLPPILATPWLIWFMEHAALELVQPFLNSGEITVGTHVDIEHLAGALLNEDVICSARLIHSEGRSYSFRIQADVRGDCLAKGIHKRRVVKLQRLAERLRQKRS